MATYLGQTDVSASDAHYGAFTPRDWALEFLEMYAGIDGEHHKQWLLDTLARILLGASHGSPGAVEQRDGGAPLLCGHERRVPRVGARVQRGRRMQVACWHTAITRFTRLRRAQFMRARVHNELRAQQRAAAIARDVEGVAALFQETLVGEQGTMLDRVDANMGVAVARRRAAVGAWLSSQP